MFDRKQTIVPCDESTQPPTYSIDNEAQRPTTQHFSRFTIFFFVVNIIFLLWLLICIFFSTYAGRSVTSPSEESARSK